MAKNSKVENAKMHKYIFQTTTTMKDYNCKKWWINGHIVPEICVEAGNVIEALTLWQKRVSEVSCITISDNAIKNKEPMYVDADDSKPKQVGYVITGKTDLQDSNDKWSTQHIDLWVSILTVAETEFSEEK